MEHIGNIPLLAGLIVARSIRAGLQHNNYALSVCVSKKKSIISFRHNRTLIRLNGDGLLDQASINRFTNQFNQCHGPRVNFDCTIFVCVCVCLLIRRINFDMNHSVNATFHACATCGQTLEAVRRLEGKKVGNKMRKFM